MTKATPRILVADNGDAMTVGVAELLRRRGMIVQTCNGHELEGEAPVVDLVVIDPLCCGGDRLKIRKLIDRLEDANEEILILLSSSYIDEPEAREIHPRALFRNGNGIMSIVAAVESIVGRDSALFPGEMANEEETRDRR
ncbi:MAG: hypothetical protein R3338_11465 [Thermoanaerobaculia bacterium]|nr:hypothetical protein [Thermoanaerobaculia bacterium]